MAAIYRTVSGSSNVHILHIVTWQPLRPMRLAAPRSTRRRGGALRDCRACRAGRRARGPKQGLGVAWQEERRGGRRRLREQDGHEGGERVPGNASTMYTPGGRACVPRRGDAFSPSPPIPEASPVSPRLLPLGVALLSVLLGGAPRSATAQAVPYDSTVFAGLKWREIGIFRGGRSVAVAGSASRPNE